MNQAIFNPKIALFIWVAFGALSAAVIYRKSHPLWFGILMGILLGPMSTVIAIFIPIKSPRNN
ncbi:MAG: hypothetical protein NT020_14105 [Chloroflexales bacterium]|nr:hypothetical protein [Chloroflexales bacterium]